MNCYLEFINKKAYTTWHKTELHLLPETMKKYHYFLIIITFSIYAFIFYQKYYGGPDVVDFFRDEGSLKFRFLDEPEKFLNKKYRSFDYFNDTFTGDADINMLHSRIYFMKNKEKIVLKCNSEFGEIIGIISQSGSEDNSYFYYKEIESIYGYDDGNSNPENKGNKILCYP